MYWLLFEQNEEVLNKRFLLSNSLKCNEFFSFFSATLSNLCLDPLNQHCTGYEYPMVTINEK